MSRTTLNHSRPSAFIPFTFTPSLSSSSPLPSSSSSSEPQLVAHINTALCRWLVSDGRPLDTSCPLLFDTWGYFARHNARVQRLNRSSHGGEDAIRPLFCQDVLQASIELLFDPDTRSRAPPLVDGRIWSIVGGTGEGGGRSDLVLQFSWPSRPATRLILALWELKAFEKLNSAKAEQLSWLISNGRVGINTDGSVKCVYASSRNEGAVAGSTFPREGAGITRGEVISLVGQIWAQFKKHPQSNILVLSNGSTVNLVFLRTRSAIRLTHNMSIANRPTADMPLTHPFFFALGLALVPLGNFVGNWEGAINLPDIEPPPPADDNDDADEDEDEVDGDGIVDKEDDDDDDASSRHDEREHESENDLLDHGDDGVQGSGCRGGPRRLPPAHLLPRASSSRTDSCSTSGAWDSTNTDFTSPTSSAGPSSGHSLIDADKLPAILIVSFAEANISPRRRAKCTHSSTLLTANTASTASLFYGSTVPLRDFPLDSWPSLPTAIHISDPFVHTSALCPKLSIDGYVGQGAVWDVYSARQIAYPMAAAVPCVFKVCHLSPRIFPHTRSASSNLTYDSWWSSSREGGLDYSTAAATVSNEIRVLAHAAALGLERRVVPRLHGVYVARPYGSGGEDAKDGLIWGMVLGDAGNKLGAFRVRNETKSAVREAYTLLHQAGIIHGDPEVRHWYFAESESLSSPPSESSPKPTATLIDFGLAKMQSQMSDEAFEIGRAHV